MSRTHYSTLLYSFDTLGLQNEKLSLLHDLLRDSSYSLITLNTSNLVFSSAY
jgi:hypothetical protein